MSKPAAAPRQPAQALPEPSLDARALPFDTGLVRPIEAAPPETSAFVPMTHTQELPNVSQGLVPASVQSPLAALPPSVTAPTTVARALRPSPVLPVEAMPPLVIRFLLVCAVVTAIGLLVLIYLEL